MYAVTDRGLATSAADTFIQAEAAAHTRMRARSARAGWPARDRPSASSVNTIISRSSSSASITLAVSWRRTVRMYAYWAVKETNSAPPPVSASSQAAT